MELLHDFAEEEGIDLENIDHEAIETSEKELRNKAEAHPAARQAKKYSKQVNGWFSNATGDFESIEEAILQQLRLGLPEDEIKKESERLVDLVEIIRWYQHQIYVKTMRALHGKYDEFDEVNPIQNDSNGSAKVALLGIKRSMSSFGSLLKFIPGQEDEIVDLLVLLQQTKNNLESAFPNAQAFKRPGFNML